MKHLVTPGDWACTYTGAGGGLASREICCGRFMLDKRRNANWMLEKPTFLGEPVLTELIVVVSDIPMLFCSPRQVGCLRKGVRPRVLKQSVQVAFERAVNLIMSNGSKPGPLGNI